MMWTSGTAPGSWWPLLIVMFVVLLAAGVATAAMLTRGRGGGPSRALDGPPPPTDHAVGQATADPLTVLRERYARGEISHDEFERYLDHLVRTEPPSGPRYDSYQD